eukprot:gene2615-3006_t
MSAEDVKEIAESKGLLVYMNKHQFINEIVARDSKQKASKLESKKVTEIHEIATKLGIVNHSRKELAIEAILELETADVPDDSVDEYHRGHIEYKLPPTIIARIFRTCWKIPSIGLDDVLVHKWRLSLGLVSKEFFKALARQFDSLSFVHARRYYPYQGKAAQLSAVSTLSHHLANPLCMIQTIRVLEISHLDLRDISQAPASQRNMIYRTVQKLTIHSIPFESGPIRGKKDISVFTALTSLTLCNLDEYTFLQSIPRTNNISKISLVSSKNKHHGYGYSTISDSFPHLVKLVSTHHISIAEKATSTLAKFGILYPPYPQTAIHYGHNIERPRFDFGPQHTADTFANWRFGLEDPKAAGIHHLMVSHFSSHHHLLINNHESITKVEIYAVLDDKGKETYQNQVDNIFDELNQCLNVTHAILYVTQQPSIKYFTKDRFLKVTDFKMKYHKYKTREFVLQQPVFKVFFEKAKLV